MNKKIFLILILILNLNLFANEMDLNKFKKIDFSIKEKNEIFINFKKEPFLEKNQINMFNFIRTSDYKRNKKFMSLLIDIYLYTYNNKLKSEILKLFKIDKKNSPNSLIKTFNKNKNKLKKENKYAVFLYEQGLKEEAHALFQENDLIEKKRAIDILYSIQYLTIIGDYEEANRFFLNYINKKLEKDFNSPRKMPYVNKNLYTILGDIYSYGVFLNFNNRKESEKYKKRVIFFHKNNKRMDYFLSKELFKKEKYKEASIFFKNIVNNDLNLKNKLFTSYFQETQKSLLNNKFDSAWINAKKGLDLRLDILKTNYNKKIYLPMLFKLKKDMKLSSERYIKKLKDKGEFAQASRIKIITIKYVSKKII